MDALADHLLDLFAAYPLTSFAVGYLGFMLVAISLFRFCGSRSRAEEIETAAQLHRCAIDRPVWIAVNKWEYVLARLCDVRPGDFYVLFDSRFDGPLVQQDFYNAALEPEGEQA